MAREAEVAVAVDLQCNCTTLHCMHDDQLTFRIPRELARQLRRLSRERGVPSSQIVREALQSYLGGSRREDPATIWSRLEPLVGSLTIDSAAVERDALTGQLRRHNWRE